MKWFYLFSLVINLNYFLNVKCNLQMASLIGGRKTILNEINYLVSLQLDGEHICGGSIIAEKFVLSAAHCVLNDNNEFDNGTWKVVAGTNNLRMENSKLIEESVEKIYVLGNYNNSKWIDGVPLGDIAVFKLKKSLNLKINTNLKKLHLPRGHKSSKSYYQSYIGKEVRIAGFGWNKVKIKKYKNNTEYEVGSSSDRLLNAKAEVISNFQCQKYYENRIHRNQLCAKVIERDNNTPQGVCRGDSGGPLVYKSKTVIGIVSGISIGCNENNEPGIYTRVSFYILFIRNALKDITNNMRVINF